MSSHGVPAVSPDGQPQRLVLAGFGRCAQRIAARGYRCRASAGTRARATAARAWHSSALPVVQAWRSGWGRWHGGRCCALELPQEGGGCRAVAVGCQGECCELCAETFTRRRRGACLHSTHWSGGLQEDRVLACLKAAVAAPNAPEEAAGLLMQFHELTGDWGAAKEAGFQWLRSLQVSGWNSEEAAVKRVTACFTQLCRCGLTLWLSVACGPSSGGECEAAPLGHDRMGLGRLPRVSWCCLSRAKLHVQSGVL